VLGSRLTLIALILGVLPDDAGVEAVWRALSGGLIEAGRRRPR